MEMVRLRRIETIAEETIVSRVSNRGAHGRLQEPRDILWEVGDQARCSAELGHQPDQRGQEGAGGVEADYRGL